MKKKGVELSMNLIIVAILGLLILGVLLYFVFGVFNGANNDTTCPSTYKGVCMSEDKCGDRAVDNAPSDICGGGDMVCCRLIG